MQVESVTLPALLCCFSGCQAASCCYFHSAAATLQVEAAQRHGTQQVLYTYRGPGSDPADGGTFEECGSMNVFFYIQQVGGGGGRRGGWGGWGGLFSGGVPWASPVSLCAAGEVLGASEDMSGWAGCGRDRVGGWDWRASVTCSCRLAAVQQWQRCLHGS